ncbi:MAG: hypothetical protein IK039_05665 [Bacteroidaceae bacterium]|nr:hypothetical protein [Bacteroidaceae bacterium]
MKIRTVKIWLSKGWYYAVYSVSLLLIPIITSCSSSRSTAKSSASKEAAVADNKTDGSPTDRTVVTFDYLDPNTTRDLSRMRLMYGVQIPQEISKDSIPLILLDGNIAEVDKDKLKKFDFEKDIKSRKKVAALLNLKPAEIKGYRKWGWSPSVALFGIKGRNGIFEVMSTEIYEYDLKGGQAGADMINSFQLYE